MKIKDLLNDDVKKILSEESLIAIQNAFDGKVQLAVESALEEQDEIYAEKLQTLIQSIDVDHTTKTKRIIESVDKNNASKLVKVIKMYERDRTNDSRKFKKTLISDISKYIDEYISECISTDDLKKAVKNKSAYDVLDNLRNVLAVDSIMMKESIQTAVLDGKTKIDKLAEENKELRTQFKALYEANEQVKKELFLESKLAKFPENKKKFISKALVDKPLEFIEENFDYTVRLFDRSETSKLKVIKEQAIENRTVKPDFVKTPQKVVSESINTNSDEAGDPYVSELSKVRKF